MRRVSHIGICVSDLDRSLGFYRDLLGFEERSRGTFSGASVDALVALEQADFDAVWLERDGTRIELLCFRTPAPTGDEHARPMNRLGLTHLSMRVDDLDATLAELRSAGIRVLDKSRLDIPQQGTAVIFVLDPDGMRIELLQAPGDPASLPNG